jgi:hypothetical protein
MAFPFSQNIVCRAEYIRTEQKKSARMTGLFNFFVMFVFMFEKCKYIFVYLIQMYVEFVHTCVNHHASWAANVVLFFQYPAISAKTFRTGYVANIIDWPNGRNVQAKIYIGFREKYRICTLPKEVSRIGTYFKNSFTDRSS